MASPNVYKPLVQGIYTRTASPDYTPPAITRSGKAVYLNATTAPSTTTMYTVPAGKRCRLVYFCPYELTLNVVCNLKIDSSTIWAYTANPAYKSSVPVINLPYESGIPILKDLTFELIGASQPASLFVILVEEDIVNN